MKLFKKIKSSRKYAKLDESKAVPVRAPAPEPCATKTITLDIPVNCQRCHSHEAKIMLRMIKTGTIEFICGNCRNEDPILRNIEVKARFR